MEEYLSALVDGADIDARNKELLLKRIESDPKLKAEYQTLKATKATLQKREQALRVVTPQALRESIIEQVRNDARAGATKEAPNPNAWLERLQDWVKRYRYTAAALMTTGFILALSLVSPDVDPVEDVSVSQAGVNFVQDAFSHYRQVVEGQQELDFRTESFNELIAYFREQGVEYSVVQLRESLQLLGGFVTVHEGSHVGHLVYRSAGSDLVYVCQAPLCLFDKKKLHLDSGRQKALLDGKWHSEHFQTEALMALKKDDKTICAVFASNNLKVLDQYLRNN